MTHYGCVATNLNTTANPSLIDSLFLKFKIYWKTQERSQYFSIFNQRKSFNQIRLSSESCQLTAFITQCFFLEWVRVPFILMNGLAVFQRFMEQRFQEFRDHLVVPCFHDLLVFSSDFSNHLKYLQLTLQRLRKYVMKLKAKKYQLFRRQLRYLGRIVAADGYKLDPSSIRAARNLARQKPKILGDVRRLIVIEGYFIKPIPNFNKAEVEI